MNAALLRLNNSPIEFTFQLVKRYTMSSKAKRHIHKYYRAKVAYQTVWACALPDCNHYMPAHLTPMMDGKATLCWKCEEQTTLTPDNLKREKPLCDDCKPIITDENESNTKSIDEWLESKGAINPISGK